MDEAIARWEEWGTRWSAYWAKQAKKAKAQSTADLFHRWAAEAREQADAEIQRLRSYLTPSA